MVVAIGAVYTSYGGIGWMQAIFYGVGTAVIGIIAMSAYKLTTKNIGKDRLLWAIFLVSAAMTVITKSESVWVFLGAGVLVWLLRAPPKSWWGGRLNGVAALLAAWFAIDAIDWHKLGQIGAYFAYAGSFVFGSGLAIVPFLYGGVVQEYRWLTERQFVDAVAVAMITPGPVVIATGFIGYLVAGFWGAVVAAIATFARVVGALPARRDRQLARGEAAALTQRRNDMKWVTRERPKIDRIACPWLIARFIDKEPEFLYVPSNEVLATAQKTGAVPYDVPGVEMTHDGERCSFDAFVRKYELTDPALGQLAMIVRGADTSRLELTPQSAGLYAMSLGLSSVFQDDHEMLRHGMVMYDALYAWCKSCQGETHNWPPQAASPRRQQ